MKIIVHEAEGKEFRIVLPTGLVLNRLTALILPGLLEIKGVCITREQTVKMIQAIRTCRKNHPGWKLAEVCSRDGSFVEISL